MSLELIKIHTDQLKGKKPTIEPIEGVWIAGGAIRQWFTGTEKPSDIDIFGTAEGMNNFVEKTLQGSVILNATPITNTYDVDGQIVQVMHGLPFATIAETLDAFDFTVCQFAWDGKDVYSTPNAAISVLRNHLGTHKVNPNFAADSLRRAFKYQRKGFIPCAGTLRDLGQAFSGLTHDDIQRQVEISPKGGKRIVRID